MRRISKVPHEYDSRQLAVGEVFECHSEHVHILLTLGRIEPQEGEPGYVARDLSPDVPPAYQTRDMAAAGSKRPYNRKAR